ncbi:predicted protein [Verticillium alfalfae VaMs.102]|uniref:Predicted protein n=1 Tax=Verticillium alfalfae (strain VaMs.102 / ATCC MYA-4576 / FGSC 10136) TaxID=526221 RepID=C9SZ34_VERA1|nr:predicted protein [Verticillium alfalfae VaMs.102]EEY24049.1 predicted protein [Verticillium alfalfae VaMs.102]
MILENPYDIEALASTDATCKLLRQLILDHSRQITSGIFTNARRRLALARSWPIFLEQSWEELLLPLVASLAQEYCAQKQEDAAVHLLTKFWRGQALFCHRPPEDTAAEPIPLRPSYSIIGSKLRDLVKDSEVKTLIDDEMKQLTVPLPFWVDQFSEAPEPSSGRGAIPVFCSPKRQLDYPVAERLYNRYRGTGRRGRPAHHDIDRQGSFALAAVLDWAFLSGYSAALAHHAESVPTCLCAALWLDPAVWSLAGSHGRIDRIGVHILSSLEGLVHSPQDQEI